MSDADGTWVFQGLAARCMESNHLAEVAQSQHTQPGRRFLSFFDAGEFDEARAGTTQTGPLSEVAAAALCDCVLQAGVPFGSLAVEPSQREGFARRFVALTAVALGDEALAARLLNGGVLDRVGPPRHSLGSLPVRVIARELARERLEAARKQLQGGWDEDLLNMLESATLRATSNPEELLVLVSLWRRGVEGAKPQPRSPVVVDEPEPRQALVDALEQLAETGASDVSGIVGSPMALHGPFGRRVLEGARLTMAGAEAVVSALLNANQRERLERERVVVTGFSVEGLGRFRLTAMFERGALSFSIRSHLVEPDLGRLGWPQDVVQTVSKVTRGLVVVAAPAGHGRSTLMTALVRAWADAGQEVITLEEPIASPFTSGPLRQIELGADVPFGSFLSAVRASAPAAVAVDLVDDAAGAELALELAAEGRLVVLTLRALSVGAAVHRLAVLDGRRHRRRLAEGLAVVVGARLLPGGPAWVPTAEVLLVSEALRRHLRGNDTPPPPKLLDVEGPSLDERLRELVHRGAVTTEVADRWLVSARREVVSP